MTTTIDTLAVPAAHCTRGRPRAWGAWATLGWVLLAFAAALLLQLVIAIGLEWWDKGVSGFQFLLRGGDPFPPSLQILNYLVPTAVLLVAARRSGWSVVEYLALVRPRGHYVLLGLACAVLPLVFTVAHAVNFEISRVLPGFTRLMNADFVRAQSAEGAFLYVIAIALAGPVMEEVMFRGFIYRGLAESRIGVAGAIVLTSIGFALIHLGSHGPARMIETALHGAAWGALRWYSGSILVPIACHVAFNGTLSLLIAGNLYGWFA